MKNRPMTKFSLGGVQGAIWINASQEGGDIYHSYSFQKSYKDKSGNWQNTEFFNVFDLCKLLIVILKLLLTNVKEYRPKEASSAAEQEPGDQSFDDENVPF